NRSASPIALQGYTISDRSSTGVISTALTLLPGAYVILCGAAQVNSYSSFGLTVAVTRFPSLDNNGDELILRDPDGRVIHAVEYNLAWYSSVLKQRGGWSLEMIDTRRPCLSVR